MDEEQNEEENEEEIQPEDEENTSVVNNESTVQTPPTNDPELQLQILQGRLNDLELDMFNKYKPEYMTEEDINQMYLIMNEKRMKMVMMIMIMMNMMHHQMKFL